MKIYLFKYNEPFPRDGDIFLSGCFDDTQKKELPVFTEDRLLIGKAIIDSDNKGVFVKSIDLEEGYIAPKRLGFGFENKKSKGEKGCGREIEDIEILEILPLCQPFKKNLTIKLFDN